MICPIVGNRLACSCPGKRHTPGNFDNLDSVWPAVRSFLSDRFIFFKTPIRPVPFRSLFNAFWLGDVPRFLTLLLNKRFLAIGTMVTVNHLTQELAQLRKAL